MHEMGIVQSIIGILEEQAALHQAKKIIDVALEFGALTAVMPDSIRFAFDVLSRGTSAEGAELHIRIIPIRTKCLDCAEETERDTYDPICPSCSSAAVVVIQGKDEIRIASIRIDDGAD
jgi:hydrogenase nickel incorporation protein HypA/HybF